MSLGLLEDDEHDKNISVQGLTQHHIHTHIYITPIYMTPSIYLNIKQSAP